MDSVALLGQTCRFSSLVNQMIIKTLVLFKQLTYRVSNIRKGLILRKHSPFG